MGHVLEEVEDSLADEQQREVHSGHARLPYEEHHEVDCRDLGEVEADLERESLVVSVLLVLVARAETVRRLETEA